MRDAEENRAGRCLCGGVTYEVLGPLQQILQCHCENCRRLSGNFVAAARAETASMDIRDVDGTLDWYDLGYARYGFCRRCGSNLFYRAVSTEELTSVMVGTLDDASGLTLGGVWFAAEAQPHNTVPEVGDHPTPPGRAVS